MSPSNQAGDSRTVMWEGCVKITFTPDPRMSLATWQEQGEPLERCDVSILR
jgi:hypothetical protein